MPECRLDQRTAFVTGACSLTGQAVVLALATEGVEVVAIDDDHDRLLGLAALAQGRIETAPMRVRDTAVVRREFDLLTNWFEETDILINCAGARAALAASEEIAPHLIALGRGVIVNVAVREPPVEMDVERITRALATRLRRHGVGCHAVAASSPHWRSPEDAARTVLSLLTA
jgi:NAD(P)-dependent dehydrogenase (short-subunit alcohol dehydrogenase family)